MLNVLIRYVVIISKNEHVTSEWLLFQQRACTNWDTQ